MRRARAWAAGADLRLWVVDGAAASASWRDAVDLVQPGDLLVLSKSDLPAACDAQAAREAAGLQRLEVLSVSAETGEGLAGLSAWLTTRAAADLGGADFPAVTRQRHARLLADTARDLERARDNLAQPELAAEDARLAGRALERITGRIGAEDVLDVIFSSFCIGK